MSEEQYNLKDVCNSIEYVGDEIQKQDKCDWTGWTTAEALSNIHYEMKRVADILETMIKK